MRRNPVQTWAFWDSGLRAVIVPAVWTEKPRESTALCPRNWGVEKEFQAIMIGKIGVDGLQAVKADGFQAVSRIGRARNAALFVG